jgi:hypothetical protein
VIRSRFIVDGGALGPDAVAQHERAAQLVRADEAVAIRNEHAGVGIDARVLDRDENTHGWLR